MALDTGSRRTVLVNAGLVSASSAEDTVRLFNSFGIHDLALAMLVAQWIGNLQITSLLVELSRL
jgi:hypothetical protein